MTELDKYMQGRCKITGVLRMSLSLTRRRNMVISSDRIVRWNTVNALLRACDRRHVYLISRLLSVSFWYELLRYIWFCAILAVISRGLTEEGYVDIAQTIEEKLGQLHKSANKTSHADQPSEDTRDMGDSSTELDDR